jgi:hypothetical protein
VTTFYGPANEEAVQELFEALGKVQSIWKVINRPSFFGDNLVALSRNMGFTEDAAFMQALQTYTERDEDRAKTWRLHTYTWACHSALRLPGDLVECGVYRGLYSAVMAAALDFAEYDRTLYLYDTFEGVPDAYSTAEERDSVNPFYNMENAFELVTERFAPYANVRIVQGVVPDSFETAAPEAISFLHLDMNAAEAEIAALDHLYERIVPGGIILLDDYGRYENRGLYDAHRKWFAVRGYMILELPTGQGMVVKR